MKAKPNDLASLAKDALRIEAISGITIRDWFAGIAMQGMIDKADLVKLSEELIAVGLGQTVRQMFASKAYEFADAMLCEREKKPI